MNNFLKTIIAGYGAKKLGGGCLSTILIFIVIYWALGTCDRNSNQAVPVRNTEVRPAQKALPVSAIPLPGSRTVAMVY